MGPGSRPLVQVRQGPGRRPSARHGPLPQAAFPGDERTGAVGICLNHRHFCFLEGQRRTGCFPGWKNTSRPACRGLALRAGKPGHPTPGSCRPHVSTRHSVEGVFLYYCREQHTLAGSGTQSLPFLVHSPKDPKAGLVHAKVRTLELRPCPPGQVLPPAPLSLLWVQGQCAGRALRSCPVHKAFPAVPGQCQLRLSTPSCPGALCP